MTITVTTMFHSDYSTPNKNKRKGKGKRPKMIFKKMVADRQGKAGANGGEFFFGFALDSEGFFFCMTKLAILLSLYSSLHDSFKHEKC